MNNPLNPSQDFVPGQIVFLKSNPSTRGAVMAVLPGTPEDRINVFVDGRPQTFYASQLQVEVEVENNDSFKRLSCNAFHAYLTALQIRYPVLSSLYSLNTASIDFVPYQYRPVLKFIKAEQPRLLIADSVGVGKTIEAGLILRELQARQDIKSVLIICPRALVTEEKWRREMKRFDENFTHLDGKTLRHCLKETHLDGEWPEQHQKVILPYSLLDNTLLYGTGGSRRRKRGNGLIDLDPPPHFDLVIVDEAHHIRNQGTANHEAVRFFCENADATVFLTATPIQLRSRDLFVLLNVLRPDLILDEESFNRMGEPNLFINQAVNTARAQEKEWAQTAKDDLDKAASTLWGQTILKDNPEFKRIKNQLTSGRVTPEERVQLITDMEALHTFSGIINRTRRRDIGEFTIRKPQTVKVELTVDQNELHEALIETQKEIYRSLHGNQSVNFMITTLRRQLASCLHGLEPLLQDILNRHLDELEWTEADAVDAMPSAEFVTHIREHVQALLERAKNLDSKDLKLKALQQIVRDRQNLPNNKIMVFSSFRHTLSYLHERLAADGFRVGMIHGGIPDEERLKLTSRFEKPRSETDSIDLMLFSEVGCEGLDYQFCDCIVNYDLPWNPMRVEQRIGRIDRRGQESESVTIFNFITPGTVDADIYERCLLRIGVFESALGGTEEILGKITTELRDIAENYALSPEERRTKLDLLADTQIRRIQENERLEAEQLELFSVQLPEDQMAKDVEQATNFWLLPESIQRLVTLYLQQKLGTSQKLIRGDKSLKTLLLSGEARIALLRDFQKLSRAKSPLYLEWENWLKGAEPRLRITFEADCRREYPDAVLIMPTHPLVKQAALSLNIDQDVAVTLKVRDKTVPAGCYEFAIYLWYIMGSKENLELKSIALDRVLSAHLDRLLKKAVNHEEYLPIEPAVCEQLETQHQELWAETLKSHQQAAREIVNFQKENLSRHQQKRIAILESRRAQVDDPNILRMRNSQIANAEADYERRIKELEEAVEKADIKAEPVVYGILEVESSV